MGDEKKKYTHLINKYIASIKEFNNKSTNEINICKRQMTELRSLDDLVYSNGLNFLDKLGNYAITIDKQINFYIKRIENKSVITQHLENIEKALKSDLNEVINDQLTLKDKLNT